MAKTVFVSYSTIGINYLHFQEVFPLNAYKRVHPSEIPLPLPKALCDKSFQAVVVGSGDSANAVYMINFSRIDGTAIDQQPFMIAYHSGDDGCHLRAGFLHHGSWDGRTVYPEKTFFTAIEGSAITSFYPYVGIPIKESGSISELQPESQRQAFWHGVQSLTISTSS